MKGLINVKSGKVAKIFVWSKQLKKINSTLSFTFWVFSVFFFIVVEINSNMINSFHTHVDFLLNMDELRRRSKLLSTNLF